MRRAGWRTAAVALAWIAPLAICLRAHWFGLKAWFWQDDFAWLSLRNLVFDRATLLQVLFSPAAQGTIRPLSERGYFLLFRHFFGVDALPFHILVFATQFGNLLLLMGIIRKMGGSLFWASAAAILWTVNASLSTPMAWCSDYNEVQCAFFLLLAFRLLLSGRYWMQAVAFVAGFGALELNVVYPALAMSWLLLNKRSVRPVLPLAALSVAYFFVHQQLAPVPAAGPYALHLDASMGGTFWSYYRTAWVWIGREWPANFALALVSGAALYSAMVSVPGRFFLAWFVITLAPFLPLRDHYTEYYLAIPTLGLAACLAFGLPAAGKALVRQPMRILALVAAAVYLIPQFQAAREQGRGQFEVSRRVRSLVLGVARAQALHPGKAIVLTDVSQDLYLDSMAHSAFGALGIRDVFLGPGTPITVPGYLKEVNAFMIPPEPLLMGLERDDVQVYSANAPILRNITVAYRRKAPEILSPGAPKRVDVGNPLMAYLLGSTWYPIEGFNRWMPGTAAIRIAGPQAPGEKLVITGYCPPEQTNPNPLSLHLSLHGVPQGGDSTGAVVFSKPELPFSRTFDLPASLIGKESIEIRLDVDHTFQSGADERRLGLAFGIFEIRKP